MLTIHQRISALARVQHALITRAQLLAFDLTEWQIDHRRDVGLLVDVHPGVYQLPGLTASRKRAIFAACLATGGVASHRAAAFLFALRPYENYRGPVEITVEGRRAPRLDGVVAHTVTQLERTTIGVIPVTMPSPTLLGLAHVAPEAADGALNHALGKGLVKLPALVRYLDELARRPGSARLRELVALQIKGERPAQSWLEDRVLAEIRRLGLPEPVRQHELHLPTGRRIIFDFARPERCSALEADGRIWHATPAARRRDAERDQAARVMGWTVERVTWLDLEEQPVEVARRIVAALAPAPTARAA